MKISTLGTKLGKRRDSRRAIIQAYIEHIAFAGVETATLEAISKKAKVAFGTVHYHFGKDRPALAEAAFLYALEHAQRFVVERVARASVSKRKPLLEAYIEANFDWAREYESHARFWVYAYFLSTTSPRFRKIHGESIRYARLRIKAIVKDTHHQKGLSAPETLLISVATRIHTDLVGSLIVAGTDPGSDPKWRYFEKIALENARDLIRGLSIQPSEKLHSKEFANASMP